MGKNMRVCFDGLSVKKEKVDKCKIKSYEVGLDLKCNCWEK